MQPIFVVKISWMEQKDIDREYRKFAKEWLPKVIERGRIFLENLENRRTIKEEDWDVIKTYHRSYYFGYCPDFILPYKPPQKQSKQTTIFDTMDKTAEEKRKNEDKSADDEFGTPFVFELPEPTIIIENGKKDKAV